MKKKRATCTFLIFISLSVSFQSFGQQGRKGNADNPPNILFILTDDQRWDALGYTGNKVIQTPNLDKLAAQGTYFENAFVTTAICCVSRASILTGQYARFSGVMDFFTPIQLETTYPRYLREGGYYTGFIGKWGTLEKDTNYFMEATDLFDFWAGSMRQSNYWHERDCNFVLNNGTSEKRDFFCDCPPDARGRRGEDIRSGKANIKDPVHQETYVIPSKVRKFLDQRDKDKPFCLSISFKAPHAPWGDYDEKFQKYYEGVPMPVASS
ncbi:MAG: sulfatase-like hydrolase/transferase, partial [Bacteroidetes bacterium]|nr:sulfatase-like hydrolase/transferase [Bacteroidota bacterium]